MESEGQQSCLMYIFPPYLQWRCSSTNGGKLDLSNANLVDVGKPLMVGWNESNEEVRERDDNILAGVVKIGIKDVFRV